MDDEERTALRAVNEAYNRLRATVALFDLGTLPLDEVRRERAEYLNVIDALYVAYQHADERRGLGLGLGST